VATQAGNDRFAIRRGFEPESARPQRKVGYHTVKKAQCNFQLENHVTFHVIGIKIIYNVKIIYISADVNLNSIEFTRYYIVHNVI
jgi:hypothetical protein